MLEPGALDLDLRPAFAAFAERGWARLGRVATDETLALLRARADDLMLGRVVHEGLFFQHDAESGRYDDLAFGKGYEGPSLEYRKIEKLERDVLFRAWLANTLFERVARALIAGPVAIYRALLFCKGARGGSVLPWHQDGGSFWGLDREPFLQIWTALDDAPVEAGCVEVLDASHRAGLATQLGGVIPRTVLDARGADARAMPLPARAGEALLVHNHVWHRSGVNTTKKPRRAFTVSYMSAATRCLRKKKKPRVFVEVFH
jgi:phytanoyl-CoA hydroxylase